MNMTSSNNLPDLPVFGETEFKYAMINDQQGLVSFCDTYSEDSSLAMLAIHGNLRGYNIDDFTILSQLQHLKGLMFKHSLTQAQFDQICSLHGLEVLVISNCKNIDNIQNISRLSSLKRLAFNVSMSSDKRHHLASIEPLGKLARLEWLQLAGIVIDKDGLQPLMNLHELRTVRVMREYLQEKQSLQKYNPHMEIDDTVS
jgi:hypothetical protein